MSFPPLPENSFVIVTYKWVEQDNKEVLQSTTTTDFTGTLAQARASIKEPFYLAKIYQILFFIKILVATVHGKQPKPNPGPIS